MTYASNTTLLGRSEDGSTWVYKPEAGERELWDFPMGSLATREVLAYELSELLGLGIVPRTRFADGPLGAGSAQLFVNEDFAFDLRSLIRPEPSDRLWPFALFDILANNADRKLGHVLPEIGTGRLWAIDNGLSFHFEPKLRTVLWGFAGRAVPDELIESVRGFRASGLERFTTRISLLLSDREAREFTKRTALLLAAPVHPDPPTDRPPLPWPLW